MRQPGLFDMDERLRRLSDIGDQLEAFARVVDFEMFRPELDAALAYGDGSRGSRPPLDPVMMFKMGLLKNALVIGHQAAAGNSCRALASLAWRWLMPGR